MYRKVLSVIGAFGAGFYFKNLLQTVDDRRSSSSSNLLLAATVNDPLSPAQPVDLVPFNNKQQTSSVTDDSMAILASGSSRVKDIMRHGYPSLDNLRIFDNYVLSYDRRNRVPNWVFEHITYERLKFAEETDRANSEFKEDTFIHPYFRSTNADYKGSGYDRGHMAAAANHRSNQKLMDQTFYLCNIAPQVGVGFNRDKWNDLEKEIRGLAKKFDNVWVCTGPLYLPKRESDNKLYVKYEVIGAQNVSVPTHFFKVALCEKNGNFSLYSYVLPNAPIDNSIPLSSFIVPIDSIERAAGFLLFDRIPRNKIKLLR